MTAKEKILIVLDEAQEYIPDRSRSDDHTDTSNIAVEALLRQGRKYRAHCWLGSQRVAHLNVSVLQQVHSYFINILPRTHDRMTVADAFAVSYDLLDKMRPSIFPLRCSFMHPWFLTHPFHGSNKNPWFPLLLVQMRLS